MAGKFTFGVGAAASQPWRGGIGASGSASPRGPASTNTLQDLLSKPLTRPSLTRPNRSGGGSLRNALFRSLLDGDVWPEGFNPRARAKRSGALASGGLARPYGLGKRGRRQLARLATKAALKRLPWLDLLEYMADAYEYAQQDSQGSFVPWYAYGSFADWFASGRPAAGNYGIEHRFITQHYCYGVVGTYAYDRKDTGVSTQGYPAYRYLGQPGDMGCLEPQAEAWRAPLTDAGTRLLPRPEQSPFPTSREITVDELGRPLVREAAAATDTISVTSPNGPIDVYLGFPPRRPAARRELKDGTKTQALKRLIAAYDAQELAALIDGLIEAANEGDWERAAQLIAMYLAEDIVVGQILKWEPKAGWSAWDPRWTQVLR